MATYNGEKYLGDQINSILSQDYTNWTLYIRDDGSNDNTLAILKRYAEQHSNILIIQDKHTHRGIKNSFLYLLEIATADYYMFCDQDDVWLPNKISISLDTIKSSPSSKPALVASDLVLVNQELSVISSSMWENSRMLNKISNLKYLEVCDYLTGCTMLLNANAKEEIIHANKDLKFNILHDQLSTLTVMSCNGFIATIKKPTVLYRQHSNNIVGGNRIKNKRLYRIKNLIKLLNKEKERFLISRHFFSTSLYRYVKLRISSINF